MQCTLGHGMILPAEPPLRSLRASLSTTEAGAYFLLAAGLDTLIGLLRAPAVLHGSLLNPDSYMRLDRLRDILTYHAPLEAVLRDASGDGALMSWSHLLDGILLLPALPLRLFLEQDAALHGAA